jgi:hypothetical protein
MPIRAIGLPSDLSLPGVDFTAMRRRAVERRDLDRAATPRQRQAIAIVRRARCEADEESSHTLAALTARTRPTTHLRTVPLAMTATPPQPSNAAQNLLGLAVFLTFVAILSVGIRVLTSESVVATPLRDSRDVIIEGAR